MLRVNIELCPANGEHAQTVATLLVWNAQDGTYACSMKEGDKPVRGTNFGVFDGSRGAVALVHAALSALGDGG